MFSIYDFTPLDTPQTDYSLSFQLIFGCRFMSAIDDTFPSPLISERLGDFVFTIFGMYA